MAKRHRIQAAHQFCIFLPPYTISFASLAYLFWQSFTTSCIRANY